MLAVIKRAALGAIALAGFALFLGCERTGSETEQERDRTAPTEQDRPVTPSEPTTPSDRPAPSEERLPSEQPTTPEEGGETAPQ